MKKNQNNLVDDCEQEQLVSEALPSDIEDEQEEVQAQLIVTDLCCGYEQKAVVSNVNFSLNKGDYLCIVGENGSGKSTLVKTLLGLNKPISGSINTGDGLKRNEIGYLPQQTDVQRDFPATVWEVVLSGCLAGSGFRPFYNKQEKALAFENIKKMGFEIYEKPSKQMRKQMRKEKVLARKQKRKEKALKRKEKALARKQMMKLSREERAVARKQMREQSRKEKELARKQKALEKKKKKEEKKLISLSFEKRCYRELSGGQQQRVLLARALCATRKLLLLDEPVTGLDPKATIEMYELIERLNREDGVTIIMISHDINAALKYATHILHVSEEVFFGTREQYVNSEYIKRFTVAGGEV